MKKIIIKSKTYGNNEILVDDEDFERVNRFKWTLNKIAKNIYAVNSKIGSLHRFIMNCKKGDKKIIDHIDHNGLNCQKRNLRFSTFSQNGANKIPSGKSIYLGVDFNYKKWRSKIRINGITTHLGLFTDEIEAAKAYDEAAEKHHGEFANLNFK